MGGLVLPGSGGGYVNPIATPVVDYDFKQNLLYGPLLSVSRASSAYIDDLAGNWTLVPANTLRRSDKGVLIEGQATNNIRNNSMQGAVAGTPGTLPTNWNGTSTQDGLSRQVVGVGSESGIDYIDIRVSGTPTASSTWTLAQPDGAVAGANGQLWTFSQFTRLSSGSLANISNMLLICSERDSAQGSTGVSATNITPTSAALASQRVPVSRTFTGSTTAFARGQIQFNYTSGQPVDITIRIGWPQLEQWNPAVAPQGGASSPIRTTGAAATRAADGLPSALAQALSTFTVAGVVQPTIPTPFGAVLRLGTTADRAEIRLRSPDATGLQIQPVVGGAGQTSTSTPAGTLPVGVRNAFCTALATGDAAISVAGSTPNTATPASVPTVSLINIGSGGSGQFFYGYIERLAILPARMVNAELQRLSTLSTWGG